MKPLYYLLMLLFAAVVHAHDAHAQLYISQVLYNPLVTTSGGEAVELYNAGDEAISLSGYTLTTTSREQDAVFPDIAIIPAHGYFLLADAGWSEKRDSPAYPLADYEQAVTMRMTDGAVALVDSLGNIVDAVGWGSASGIPNHLYSGTPANPVQKGESLRRIAFTGSNADDFTASIPAFTNARGETRHQGAASIVLHTTILSPETVIRDVNLPFDADDMLLLYPGKEREVVVSFTIHNDLTNLSLWHENVELPYVVTEEEQNVTITAMFSLPSDTPAGAYMINISGTFDGEQLSRTIVYTIPSLLAFGLDAAAFRCRGETCISEQDDAYVSNLGNVPLDLRAAVQESEQGIPASRITAMVGTHVLQLSASPQHIGVGIVPGNHVPLAFSVDTEGISPGEYATHIILQAVQHE